LKSSQIRNGRFWNDALEIDAFAAEIANGTGQGSAKPEMKTKWPTNLSKTLRRKLEQKQATAIR